MYVSAVKAMPQRCILVRFFSLKQFETLSEYKV